MANPELDSTKVVLHIQANNNTAIDSSDNQVSVTAGSNNLSVTNNTLNHPATAVDNIIIFNPPSVDDGVFRNLRGLDTLSSYISGDDGDFVIGGFYSEKHRQLMLSHFNTLTQGASGRTFYMNDREVAPVYLFSIDEVASTFTMQPTIVPISNLFDGQDLLNINDGNITITVNNNNTQTDPLIDLIGTDIQIKESRMFVTLDPITQAVDDYDVWSESNNLSAASNYPVGSSAYETDVLPLIQDYLNNLA